jgi:hypothetical protein
VLPIATSWRGNKKLFDKLYAELSDLDVGYAWFHFLLNRHIGDFSPTDPPPIDGTREAKLKCMSTTHRFVMDFFAQDDFPDQLTDDMSSVSMCKLENDIIICGKKTLFRAYKKFCYDFYSGSKVQLNTFTDKLSEVGIVLAGRKRFRKYSTQLVCVTVSFDIVAEKYDELYDLELTPWFCKTDSPEFLKKYNHLV